MNLKIFILFLYLVVEGIEGANLPSNVAQIHQTATNVGEIAPASSKFAVKCCTNSSNINKCWRNRSGIV
ncbi:unnamed protein product [Meloidogyne enterolobii]|uniref:Uncharacterized protein n=1 Tax=Meloidogyne enterolobii TaxID=390850 RepID=A0ACB1AP00_MELEN